MSGLLVFPPHIVQHKAGFYCWGTMVISLSSHNQLDKGALWLIFYSFSLLSQCLPFLLLMTLVYVREVEFADDIALYLHDALDNIHKTKMALTTFCKEGFRRTC